MISSTNMQLSSESNCQLPTNVLATTKKSVSFSSSARVRKTTHVNDYTLDEIDACWYSKAEMQAIRDEVDSIVEQISINKVSMKKEKVLGLEVRFPQIQQQRFQTRIAAWDAVLDEQDMGSTVEEIAQAYNAISYQSQIAATMMATNYISSFSRKQKQSVSSSTRRQTRSTRFQAITRSL